MPKKSNSSTNKKQSSNPTPKSKKTNHSKRASNQQTVRFSLLFKFVIAIALLIVITSVMLTRFFLQKQADLYLQTLNQV